MRIIVCEIQSKVISNFFRMSYLHNIWSKKRDHSIPEIYLLFHSNDHSISHYDISTFKSLLVHLFYIYSRSRYVHFYICVCKNSSSIFCFSVAHYSVRFWVNTISFHLSVSLIHSWTYLEDTNRCKSPDSSNKRFY